MTQKKKHPKTYEEARKLVSNVQMAYYVLSAIKLGIDYEIVLPGLFVEFSKGTKRWRIHKALTPINNSVAMSLASYKNICNQFLRLKGFPVPPQALVTSAEDIFAFMKEHKTTAIVVKPIRGFGGIGVSILPDTEEEIRHAYNYAEEKCMSDKTPKVLVEKFVRGSHFRMVVLDSKVIAASERMAPYVIGNGRSTVKQLIARKNGEYAKEGHPKIKVDEEAQKALEDQNVKLTDIPKKNERITVRFNANMTSGGTTRECLGEVHQEYKTLAINIVKEIGLKLGGIDLITPDITDPSVKYYINEVNHNPGLRIHYMPDEGDVVDIATTIQQYILDNI